MIVLYKIRIELETYGICCFAPIHRDQLSTAKRRAKRYIDDLESKIYNLKTEIIDEQEKVVSCFKNGFWTDYIGRDNGNKIRSL